MPHFKSKRGKNKQFSVFKKRDFTLDYQLCEKVAFL